ncbi:MAG: MarR family winged helix-turn-helix transcriptional regulator [Frankiaceae bacterium]
MLADLSSIVPDSSSAFGSEGGATDRSVGAGGANAGVGAGGATSPGNLSSALRIGVMRLARRLRQERSGEFTLTQMSALATIDRKGPMTLGQLADHERVQPPSMTRVVSHLVAAGLLSRTPSPEDRRQALVESTPSGKALLTADRRRRDEWLTERLQQMTPDELEVLRAAVPLFERLAVS